MTTLLYVILCLAILFTTEAFPVILSSSSGTFTYPTYTSRYPSATKHTWLIKVEEGKHINLTLHVTDVEAYRGKCIDIIEIKDGGNSKAPLLGGYCNSNKPAYSILSSSNALRVWFQSAKNSDGGLGFNVSYTTVPNQACGGQLESFPGTFSTPRYPLPYPNNRECTWKIHAPHGMFIHVEFHDVYHLESMCVHMECECIDTLEIQDGGKALPYAPSYGYCFSKPRPFTSRTNEVSVKFVSDYSGRFQGFSATYTTSLTEGCGADLWSKHGLITSPNYPHSYHSYKTCIWRISVPDNHYVIMTFHEFDINASHRACFVDNVAIYNGYTQQSPLLGKLCNGHFVSNVNSTGNKVYIVFQSGFNLNAKGFKATYASHVKDEFPIEVKKREPRHSEMDLYGFSQKKPINMAADVIATWWPTTIALLGILGYTF